MSNDEKTGKVIRFPGMEGSVRAALEDALAEADSIDGVIIIAQRGCRDEETGETFTENRMYVGGGDKFNDKDIIYQLDKWHFTMMNTLHQIADGEIEIDD